MAAAILVLVVACGAIAAGWGYVRTSLRMRGFATTRGTVIRRELSTIPGGGREGRWGRGGRYLPTVTYTYRVDGVAYTSDRWSYAAAGLKRAVAQEQLDAVPEDVDVHYDPAAPQEAYLEKSTPLVGYLLIAGGVIGLIGSTVALLG